MRSPLAEAQNLVPGKGGAKAKKKAHGHIPLTSLVDTFVIILLFLLVQGPGTESSLEMKELEKLPTATKLEALHGGTIVRVEGRQYFVDDVPVSDKELAKKLQEIKQNATGEFAEALIIQANKTADFSDLTPIVRAGSLAGFNKFRFAVLQGEET